jgi:hypothetical protein
MDSDSIRKRTSEEDTLLGSRTTAFLIGNGFVLTALGSNPEPSYKAAIAIFGFIVSILWLLTTIQSYRVIQALHALRPTLDETDQINDTVISAILWKADSVKTLLGPTALIAIWLPSTVIGLWIMLNLLMRFSS